MPDEAASGPTPPGEGPANGVPHASPTLDRALDLVRFLRARCPWDREQTPQSLVPHLLEESHEVADAIHEGDPAALEGELGDLLLNLAFQIVLAEEQGSSGAAGVVERLEAKMRGRHPHLFGGGEGEGWEALKARERGPSGGVLDGMARGLDPLTASHRIQERVSGVGFDWADYRGALAKVEEELAEVTGALEQAEPSAGRGGGGSDPEGARAHLEEELGDLLFAVVNLARLVGVHATTALAQANRKFRRRFERLEALARERGVVLREAGLTELDRLWDELKAEE